MDKKGSYAQFVLFLTFKIILLVDEKASMDSLSLF